MLSCSTVAIETHTKYGTCATVAHLKSGQIAIINQRSVPQTIKMSSEARGRFRIPAKIGMNVKFAARLMANGRAITHGTLPRNTCTKTKPNVTMMTG